MGQTGVKGVPVPTAVYTFIDAAINRTDIENGWCAWIDCKGFNTFADSLVFAVLQFTPPFVLLNIPLAVPT